MEDLKVQVELENDRRQDPIDLKEFLDEYCDE